MWELFSGKQIFTSTPHIPFAIKSLPVFFHLLLTQTQTNTNTKNSHQSGAQARDSQTQVREKMNTIDASLLSARLESELANLITRLRDLGVKARSERDWDWGSRDSWLPDGLCAAPVQENCGISQRRGCKKSTMGLDTTRISSNREPIAADYYYDHYCCRYVTWDNNNDGAPNAWSHR